jgi:hypothetical protein
MNLNFKIDNYQVNMFNLNKIIIINTVTGKKTSFNIDNNTSIEDKIYLISRQLMQVNKMKNPKYKTIFNSLIEAQDFIQKLKTKINNPVLQY